MPISVLFATVVGLAACGSDQQPSTTGPANTGDTVATVPTESTGSSEPTGSTGPSQDLSELIGRTWMVESFITVGGLNPTPAGSTASLLFDGKGLVMVNTGCNTGSGPVTFAADNTLTIGPVTTTLIACAPALNDLERRIVALLQLPSYWSVDGDMLTIYPTNVTDTGMKLRARG